ncbi:hypothetical protein [Xanthomonas fragariae]|uniref:hypothetical protein n=1 Tax=Xanthomonas fragariae TaxID=48664 RepID=UPI000A35CBE6|nr:hypothetical protein [Xanthomonas fragariae]SMQ97109.1 Hypothetical Protein NBC2815_03795 [Xanthomonas fragariae]
MQQHAVTRTQISGTGPGQEASTPAGAGFDLAAGKDSSAIATLYITHDTVVVVAALAMGQHTSTPAPPSGGSAAVARARAGS